MNTPVERVRNEDARRPGLLRQPALHFACLAFVLLGLDAGRAEEPVETPAPVVDEELVVEQLRSDFETAQGRPMTAEEEASALEDFRYEESLFAASLAAGFHQTDPIVRRRLVQRMRFLIESAVQVPPATDEQLREVIAANPAHFPEVHILSFEHRYFARSVHGVSADDVAEAALESLRSGDDIEGDPFPRRLPQTQASLSDVARVVGPQTAAAFSDGEMDTWRGPIRSAYGAHVVRVTERIVREPALSEVRARAEVLWQQQVREERGREFAQSILEAQ